MFSWLRWSAAESVDVGVSSRCFVCVMRSTCSLFLSPWMRNYKHADPSTMSEIHVNFCVNYYSNWNKRAYPFGRVRFLLLHQKNSTASKGCCSTENSETSTNAVHFSQRLLPDYIRGFATRRRGGGCVCTSCKYLLQNSRWQFLQFFEVVGHFCVVTIPRSLSRIIIITNLNKYGMSERNIHSKNIFCAPIFFEKTGC